MGGMKHQSIWLVYCCCKLTLHSFIYSAILVGGIPTPLKNMSSSVGMIIPYMKWKIKAMFQTTNQNKDGQCCFPRSLVQRPSFSQALMVAFHGTTFSGSIFESNATRSRAFCQAEPSKKWEVMVECNYSCSMD